MVSTENGRVEVEKSNPLDTKTSHSRPLSNEGLDSSTVSSPQIANDRDKFSGTNAFHKSLMSRVFARKLDWGSLQKIAKEWIRNPMNMVLLVWIVCVAVSGAILFLVMTGMLNHALPRKSQREAWFEVNNQILNALFTLICLYHHPHRLYHLVLLLRWRPEDALKLRELYCKEGTSKPHERAHMLVVILLLHLNCFAQYALCGLNVGYSRSDRPPIGVAITISVAIAAPAIAGVYTVVSPLGKDYDMGSDEESQVESTGSFKRRFSFSSKDDEARTSVSSPTWSGGILDLWEDISIAHLSLFCSFCVFGWNMERLGFGNMYVHTATFLLFCLAPFWIFNLAAINVNNETAREALGTTGVFLCVFGLLYGGFWRIQMRKRFNLPPSDFCCRKPAVTDCASWLFCCWCSLAQEVRTGNSYDIVEHKFYKKPGVESCEMLPQEGGFGFGFGSGPSSPPCDSSSSPLSPSRLSKERHSSTRQPSMVEEDSSSRGKDLTLQPPLPSIIHR